MKQLFEHKYPYVDNHELNLDWIIQKMIELDEKMDERIKETVEKYLSKFSLEATYNPATEELVFSLKKGE